VKYDPSGNLEVASWVRVEGILGFKVVDGPLFPCIKADTVVSIDAPRPPYLYPGVFQ